jgi:hypothetical protein
MAHPTTAFTWCSPTVPHDDAETVKRVSSHHVVDFFIVSLIVLGVEAATPTNTLVAQFVNRPLLLK